MHVSDFKLMLSIRNIRARCFFFFFFFLSRTGAAAGQAPRTLFSQMRAPQCAPFFLRVGGHRATERTAADADAKYLSAKERSYPFSFAGLRFELDFLFA